MSDEWRSTKLRNGLMDRIADAVEGTKVSGVPKYDSVPDFIQTACISLLKKEGYWNDKEKEVAA